MDTEKSTIPIIPDNSPILDKIGYKEVALGNSVGVKSHKANGMVIIDIRDVYQITL